jgi:hypothetical protein
MTIDLFVCYVNIGISVAFGYTLGGKGQFVKRFSVRIVVTLLHCGSLKNSIPDRTPWYTYSVYI